MVEGETDWTGCKKAEAGTLTKPVESTELYLACFKALVLFSVCFYVFGVVITLVFVYMFLGFESLFFVNKYSCIFIRKPLSPTMCVLLPTCNHVPAAYIPHREMAGSGHFHREREREGEGGRGWGGVCGRAGE